MIDDPDCPVCDGHDWKIVARRVFKAADGPRRAAYVALRYRVLFELWRPGAAELELTLQYCGGCGLLIYTPRPTQDELAAKYRFLEQATPTPPRSRLGRARHLHDRVAPHLPPGPAAILDLGGGTGDLLAELVRRGHRGYTVDFVERTIPGVERIGSTIDDVPADRRFDLVVCSHVLEHVAEPRAVLARLVERLAPGGLAYVELPLELLGGTPAMREPVTHINFFTPGSAALMCARAGLDVASVAVTPLLETLLSYDTSVHILARRSERPATAPEPALARQTADALRPSLAAGVRWLAHLGGLVLRPPAEWARRRAVRAAGAAPVV